MPRSLAVSLENRCYQATRPHPDILVTAGIPCTDLPVEVAPNIIETLFCA